MKKRRGFTLVELIITIALIGLVSAMFVSYNKGAQIKARDNQRKSDLQAISTYLERYYAENKHYPNNPSDTTRCTVYGCFDDSLEPVVDPPIPWIDELTSEYTDGILPEDPKNTNDYYYTYSTVSPFDTYILLTRLENQNDPEIYNKPGAKCTNSGGGWGTNNMLTRGFVERYCVTSPKGYKQSCISGTTLCQ